MTPHHQKFQQLKTLLPKCKEEHYTVILETLKEEDWGDLEIEYPTIQFMINGILKYFNEAFDDFYELDKDELQTLYDDLNVVLDYLKEVGIK